MDKTPPPTPPSSGHSSYVDNSKTNPDVKAAKKGPKSVKTQSNVTKKNPKSQKKWESQSIRERSNIRQHAPKHETETAANESRKRSSVRPPAAQPKLPRLSEDFAELAGLRNKIVEMKGTSYNKASIYEKSAFDADLKASGDRHRKNDVVMTQDSIHHVLAVKTEIKSKIGNREPRTLCLIDVQNTFINGNLQVQGAEGKVFGSLKELVQHNKSLPADKKLFDVLVMSKDRHPDNHVSFTSRYFEKPEPLDNGAYRLPLTEEGKDREIVLNGFLNELVGKVKVENNGDGSFTLSPTDSDSRPPIEYVMQQLLFAKGKNPQTIDVDGSLKTVSTDRKVREEIVKWFENNKYIDGHHRVMKDVSMDSLDFDKWPEDKTSSKRAAFQAFLNKIGCKGKEQAILDCLKEDYWPDHSNPKESGDHGHEFHPELVKALAEDPDIPIVVTAKGTGQNAPEAYSAAKATDGSRASGLLQSMRLLGSETVSVAGVATGYCPSGTAMDINAMANAKHHQVQYLTPISKGLGEEAETATHNIMKDQKIVIVEAFDF